MFQDQKTQYPIGEFVIVKIAYYCQHVLGIGHFHRSLAICNALATRHAVTLIVGGREIDSSSEKISYYQLPGLQMDSQFQNLAPCNPEASLDETKQARIEQLTSFFEHHKPDIFIVELYPFGRKAFRFELDPILKGIQTSTLHPCKCYVSLRDILVERKDDKEKFEQRAVTTLNKYFHGLLIHSDESVITLDETFARVSDITIPMAYTGFVTRKSSHRSREEMRRKLQLHDDEKLVVASIGGGSVGSELLEAAIEAFRFLNNSSGYRMQLFTGPYCNDAFYQKLQQLLPEKVKLDRFTDHFPSWLQAADLSISMGGYNTCMNIIEAGIPALIYPFMQNREQRFRAERFKKKGPITLLTPEDLQPGKLAGIIQQNCMIERQQSSINLNGTEGSLHQIEAWHNG